MDARAGGELFPPAVEAVWLSRMVVQQSSVMAAAGHLQRPFSRQPDVRVLRWGYGFLMLD